MRKHSLTLLCTATVLALACQATAQATLTPLPGFGTSGWLAPGTSPYLSTLNTERGLAYNPLTGNLVLASRQNVGGISNNIRILSGTTGADLNTPLDPTGIAGGQFTINQAGVADDGSIYVANLSISATSNFKVYRWDSELLGQTTPPVVAYDALSGLARTGDSFAVQGGLVTAVQFAAAGSNNISASNFVVGAVDSTNTSTAFLSVPGTTGSSNDYRLSIAFVDATTLIGNQGNNAQLTAFDTTTVSATVNASIPLGGLARRALDYAVVGGRPVLAVLDSNSSQLSVFDVTNPTSPALLVQGNNTTGTLTANVNGTGAVAFGPVTGNTAVVYAMNSNQGIQAFTLDLSPLANATSFGIGCDGLGLVNVGLPAVGNSTFELQVTGVSPISPIAFVAFGTTALPGIDLTGIGMPGCSAYSSLDIALNATGPVVGGVGSYPLPLPNTPSLVNSAITAQGVGLTLATPLNLSASNGVTLLVGF